MSHELRTPLNEIIGFTGTLLMKMPGPINPEQDKQLRTVQASAKHLLALITDLLDVAKIEAGKFELDIEPVDCKAVVDEVAAAQRPHAEDKGLGLSVNTAGETLVLHTDRRMLAQILLNLANNAIKFTEHGRVRLQVSRCRTNGSSAIEFAIEDTGIGIREEDKPKLFIPFARVNVSNKKGQEGTGLGLHLSEKLAAALGGRITLESEFGRGSTFTLIIPE